MDNKNLNESNELLTALESLRQQLIISCSTAANPPAKITISFQRNNETDEVIQLYDDAAFAQHFLDAVDETIAEL